HLIREMHDGHLPGEVSARTLAAFTELGERQARQGATMSDLVHGWRVCGDELIRRAREVTSDDPNADSLLVHLFESIMAWLDVGLVASAEGHRTADLERTRQEQHARATLIRRLVAGRLDTGELRLQTDAFGLDRGDTYHAVRARPVPGLDATQLERQLGGRQPAGSRGGVLALIDGDICGFVNRLPTEPVPAPVGVSVPVTLDALGPAFRTASRLLDAARALNRTGLITLETLGVEAAVVTDHEVGEAMLDRYVRPLEALGPAGALVLDTVSRYLSNDNRLDTTARELHVHVNTVRYRLGRFEQVTHHSLRDISTLVEVWWALRRRALA
ncbi:MAG TPA: helix-turn-helix domain-containing protein, partial [Kineosporiaceae bacterium]|nr:helix-turn-helix domain-containing protein [Kineosporiaceae bacterium]